MKRLVLLRNYMDEKVTLGDLFLYEGKRRIFACRTLELPWKGNVPKTSCIPAGVYSLKFEYSPAFKQNLFELKDVPNRSEIKIHAANYTQELLGCIAVGAIYSDINKDGVLDLGNSKVTLAKLHDEIFPETSIKLTIVNL